MDRKPRYRRRHRERLPTRLVQAGYSLYDLLITSALASVLGLGTVGMTGMVQDARLTAAVNRLMGDLSLARSEAIKRHAPVTVCAGTAAGDCHTAGEWREGWIMFVDANGNGKLEPADPVLRAPESPSVKSLRFGAWGPGTGRWVTYEADGTTKQNGTFTFCDTRGAAKAKAVILLGTGRPRVSSVNSSGQPLRCP